MISALFVPFRISVGMPTIELLLLLLLQLLLTFVPSPVFSTFSSSTTFSADLLYSKETKSKLLFSPFDQESFTSSPNLGKHFLEFLVSKVFSKVLDVHVVELLVQVLDEDGGGQLGLAGLKL